MADGRCSRVQPDSGMHGAISRRWSLPISISTALRTPRTKRVARLLKMGLGCALFAAGAAFAAPGGELDASFGENGRVAITLSGPSFGSAGVQQADRKLLVAGTTEMPGAGFDFAVLRLNVDGTLDTTFGTGGIATVDFRAIGDFANVVLLQPDGKIVAAGSAETSEADSNIALARFNANGTLDTTFGTDGRATLDLGGGHELAAGAVLVQGGQIVVAGTSDTNGNYDVVFARFNANGTLDTTFGTNGSVLVDTNGEHNEAFWLTQQADGKLIACGLAASDPNSVFMQAVRVNANGTVDTTFGVAGVADIVTGAQYGYALTCIAMPDGTTVLAGSSDTDLALARLSSIGVLDTTFGTGGQSTADLGGSDQVRAMLLLSDGKLGVTGSVSVSEPRDIYIARFNADGSLDTTFGNRGATIADFGSASRSAQSVGGALVEQADGKLVAIGHAAGSDFDAFAIVRVDPAGAGSAGVVGLVETTTGVGEEAAIAVLTARRTGGSVGAVSVDYATAAGTALPGSDFEDASGTLTWNDGDVDQKTITINLIDDSNQEGNESFFLSLTSPTGGAVLAASEAITFIYDDLDGPGGLSIDPLGNWLAYTEGKSNISVRVYRNGGSEGEVSVSYTTKGTAMRGVDFVISGTLTWADGEAGPKSLHVDLLEDAVVENSESLYIELTAPTGGATISSSLSLRRQTIIITDNDEGFFLPVTAVSVNENGGSLQIAVARSGASNGAASVDLATADGTAVAGSDYVAASGTLTWAAGDASDKTIEIAITDDQIDENNESFTVSLSNPTGGLALAANSTASVTIADDDAPPPPPPSRSGGGGGGSTGFLSLLFLSLAELFRVLQRKDRNLL